ncbi:hypothetical protein CYMTET_8265 [Cymbomonas tetramitiformis]|uniref:Uncharacterized protein n=1 Tax=Cymbomonas tetramitiformis TaxID=36881 RepID=A0AAE0GTE3_9CHLO|nr:hypothetical protein CYMTET_8265 [Cymbomonas tetramitiformis]
MDDASSTASPLDGKRVLLDFARRLLHCDDPFQGTLDLVAVRVVAGKDPHDAISDFNAALVAARTSATHLVDGDPLSDLRDMLLKMKRQLTALTTKAADGSRGFTPRAEKAKNDRIRKFRFAAEPLKEGGNHRISTVV